MIEYSDVSVDFGDGPVLSGVSGSFSPDAFTCLFGKSGTGKSTLLKTLCHMIPFEGTVTLDGTDIRTMSPTELRRSVHYLHQTPVVFPGTVQDNLLLPFTLKAAKGKKPTREQMIDALDRATLNEKFLDKTAQKLSGGEKQRVAIARAMLMEPSYILLDEPTSALDMVSEQEILDLLDALSEVAGIIVVSHSKAVIHAASRRIVVEQGSIREISGAPSDEELYAIIKNGDTANAKEAARGTDHQ